MRRIFLFFEVIQFTRYDLFTMIDFLFLLKPCSPFSLIYLNAIFGLQKQIQQLSTKKY